MDSLKRIETYFIYKTVIICIILSLLISTQAFAENPFDSYGWAKVKVYVSTYDNIKAQVESYILRELRDIKDAHITEGEHNWLLWIIVRKFPNIDSFVLSLTVFHSVVSPKELIEALEEAVGPNQFSTINHRNSRALFYIKLIEGAYRPEHQETFIDKDLRNICAQAVAYFDVNSLEKMRKSFQQSKEISREVFSDLIKQAQDKALIIRKAQSSLKGLKFYNGDIDGIFGSQTQAALRQFQQSKGLSVTGEIDDATRKALVIQ